jgi:hypothetical protein
MTSQHDRSIFENNNDHDVDYGKQLIGMAIYLLCFGITIPYLVIKSNNISWLEGYIPNLDLIASVVGFRGGPFGSGIFKYLYNPNTNTVYGYYSQTVFNYIALLGLTYIIAYYTFKTNSINNGWSRAFVMLWLTYLLPSNFVALLSDKLGGYVDRVTGTNKYTYVSVVGVGMLLLFGLVMLEKNVVQYTSPLITKSLDKVSAYLKTV